MIFEQIANTMNYASKLAHENAVGHGFYDGVDDLTDYLNVNDQPKHSEIARRDFILAQLAKIASEVGEAVAVIQKQRFYEGLNEELADITIRTMDLAAYMGYQHGNDVAAKMERNSSRPRLHGKIC